MKDGNSTDILEGGVRIITLSIWHEFHQMVNSLRSKRGYVWRGQKKDETCGWLLQSSFDRVVQSDSQHDRTERLKHHLNKFRDAMNKSYPGVLPQEDADIWALGQHYGLMTPLLDWTLSPYIAAYFAFKDEIDHNEFGDNYRYVFAMNRSIERLISKRKRAGQVLSSDRSVPFVDQLSHPNPRFMAQKAIFTIALQGKDIQEYVQSFSRKRPGEAVIVKFRIPTSDREECLNNLHLMNIDHTSLLLDLRDVVNRCNGEL